jgi:hypothetical protein
MIVFVQNMEVKLHSYITSALDGDERSVVVGLPPEEGHMLEIE